LLVKALAIRTNFAKSVSATVPYVLLCILACRRVS
jgi:hypothetical protein